MTNKRTPVFVVGNFVQACCWFVPRIPLAGETLNATGVQIEAGGKGLNVAIALNRLGLDVKTLIAYGNDSAGKVLLDLFIKEKISCKTLFQFDTASGWGSGWIAQDGQNAIAVSLGANLLLNQSHVEQCRTSIEQAKLVYGQFETSLEAVEASFKIATLKNIPTILNPSPWQEPTLGIQQNTKIMIANEVEAQFLLGLLEPLTNEIDSITTTIQAKLANLWHKWSKLDLLIVTLGALGCIAFTRPNNTFDSASVLYNPGLSIKAVDTVGAGDGFASGFCLALLQQFNLEDCLKWGNALGAHMASHVGVLHVLPYSHQLEQILQNPTILQHNS